jgi:hypothetical protein
MHLKRKLPGVLVRIFPRELHHARRISTSAPVTGQHTHGHAISFASWSTIASYGRTQQRKISIELQEAVEVEVLRRSNESQEAGLPTLSCLARGTRRDAVRNLYARIRHSLESPNIRTWTYQC